MIVWGSRQLMKTAKKKNLLAFWHVTNDRKKPSETEYEPTGTLNNQILLDVGETTIFPW